MLSVILAILKILGIAVLLLLILILVLLLLLLFVPFRYSCHGYAAEKKGGDFRVTWLLRLLRLKIEYSDGLSGKAQILCFPVWKLEKEAESGTENAAESDDSETEKSGNSEASESGESGTAEFRDSETAERGPDRSGAASAETPHSNIPEAEGANPVRETEGTHPVQETESAHFTRETHSEKYAPEPEAAVSEESCKGEVSDTEEFSVPEKRKSLRERFARRKKSRRRKAAGHRSGTAKRVSKGTKESFPEKLLKKKADLDKIVAFFQEQSTKRLIHLFRKMTRRLLREIFPRKISGEIRYGAEDPSKTGSFAEAAALLLPILEDRVRMVPVFDREEFYADLTFSGKIHLWVIAWAAARIWFDRDFKKTLRTVKRWKKGDAGKKKSPEAAAETESSEAA